MKFEAAISFGNDGPGGGKGKITELASIFELLAKLVVEVGKLVRLPLRGELEISLGEANFDEGDFGNGQRPARDPELFSMPHFRLLMSGTHGGKACYADFKTELMLASKRGFVRMGPNGSLPITVEAAAKIVADELKQRSASKK